MGKTVATGLSSNNVSLRPNATTSESGTYNLAARTVAKITPKGYDVPLVVDGVELFPKITATGENLSTNSTSYATLYTVPEGYTVRVKDIQYRHTTGQTTFVRMMDSNGITLATEESGVGSNFQYYNNGLDKVLTGGDVIQARSNTGSGSAELRVSIVAEELVAERLPFDVYGGENGITITGDTFFVTTYSLIQTTNNTNLVQNAPATSSVKTGMYTIPAGKYAKVKCLEAYDTDFTVDGNIAEFKRRIIHQYITTTPVTDPTFGFPSTCSWRLTTFNLTFDKTVTAGSILLIQGTTSYDPRYPRLPFKAADASIIGADQQTFEFYEYRNGNAYDDRIMTLAKEEIIHEGNALRPRASQGSIRVYSYYVSAVREGAPDMYEAIVPAGTVLNGERYSVTEYNE